MKILLIDDNTLSGLIEKEVLSTFGNCDFAKDGIIGLNKYTKSITDLNPYDIIFLDIIMPKYSGYQILEMIRSYEKSNGVLHPVKVIILSELNEQKHIDYAFELGANGFVSKPIDRNKIESYFNEEN